MRFELFEKEKPEPRSAPAHDVCERTEVSLRARISDLEDQVKQLLDKVLEISEEAMSRERALMDKVIATQNPGIARALMMVKPDSERAITNRPDPRQMAKLREPIATPQSTGYLNRVPLQRRTRSTPSASASVAVAGTPAADAAVAAASAALAEGAASELPEPSRWPLDEDA